MLYVEEEEDVYVTETIYNRETGLPVFQRTLLNGLRESPPDRSPSEIGYDYQGRPDRMEWHCQDQWHREDGPSSIYINPENGIHTVENFRVHGELPDPSLGPSTIVRNSETGEITTQYHEAKQDLFDPATTIKPGPALKL